MPGEVEAGHPVGLLHGKGGEALEGAAEGGVGDPSLHGFKSPVDVALGDMGEWWPWQYWGTAGLNDFRVVFEPK